MIDRLKVYCALNAIMNPSRFSLAYFAVLQQSSMTLRYSLQSILDRTKSFRQEMSKLKQLYAVSERDNKLQEGDISYPTQNSNDSGMAFELRYVALAVSHVLLTKPQKRCFLFLPRCHDHKSPGPSVSINQAGPTHRHCGRQWKRKVYPHQTVIKILRCFFRGAPHRRRSR